MPAHISGVYIQTWKSWSYISTPIICAGTNNRSIYLRTKRRKMENNDKYFLPLKGKISPGKGFLWGIIHQKMGLCIFWGNILLKKIVQYLLFLLSGTNNRSIRRRRSFSNRFSHQFLLTACIV